MRRVRTVVVDTASEPTLATSLSDSQLTRGADGADGSAPVNHTSRPVVVDASEGMLTALSSRRQVGRVFSDGVRSISDEECLRGEGGLQVGVWEGELRSALAQMEPTVTPASDRLLEPPPNTTPAQPPMQKAVVSARRQSRRDIVNLMTQKVSSGSEVPAPSLAKTLVMQLHSRKLPQAIDAASPGHDASLGSMGAGGAAAALAATSHATLKRPRPTPDWSDLLNDNPEIGGDSGPHRGDASGSQTHPPSVADSLPSWGEKVLLGKRKKGQTTAERQAAEARRIDRDFSGFGSIDRITREYAEVAAEGDRSAAHILGLKGPSCNRKDGFRVSDDSQSDSDMDSGSEECNERYAEAEDEDDVSGDADGSDAESATSGPRGDGGNLTTLLPPLPTAAPQQFGSIVFVQHFGSSPRNTTAPEGAARSSLHCHHTLMVISRPVTIQGPCLCVGLGHGEVAIGGFIIGSKHLALPTIAHRAVVTPLSCLKERLKSSMEMPKPRVPAVVTSLLRGRGSNTSSSARGTVPCTVGKDDRKDGFRCRTEKSTADLQELLQLVDWDWVEQSLALFGGLLKDKRRSALLLLQRLDLPKRIPHGGDGVTRKVYILPAGGAAPSASKSNSSARSARPGLKEVVTLVDSLSSHGRDRLYVAVPRCVARHRDPGVDLLVLPKIFPSVLKQTRSGTVAVVGSQGIGKSTLSRFFANGLLSQYGVCYWLDLDLGQPEFGFPGTVSLFRVNKPLFRPHDSECAEEVVSFFLGSTSVRCPVSMSVALAAICRIVQSAQGGAPVVANTHGWVLSTGRRSTVEALRRLRPRHVVHLVLEGEEQWVREDVLWDPENGLNSSTVHSRFALQKRRGTNTDEDEIPQLAQPTDAAPGTEAEPTSGLPEPILHTLVVSRAEGTSAGSGRKVVRGGHAIVDPTMAASRRYLAANLREGRWRRYFAPIVKYFERKHMMDLKLDGLYEVVESLALDKGSRQRGGRLLVTATSQQARGDDGAAVATAARCTFDGETDFLRFDSTGATAVTPPSAMPFSEEKTPLDRAVDRARRIWAGIENDQEGLRCLRAKGFSTLRIPFRDVSRFVLLLDDVEGIDERCLSGMLEHSIVAVSFDTFTTKVASVGAPAAAAGSSSCDLAARSTVITSLSSVGRAGFPISAFGLVADSEQHLLRSFCGRRGGQPARADSSSVSSVRAATAVSTDTDGGDDVVYVNGEPEECAGEQGDGYMSVYIPMPAGMLRGMTQATRESCSGPHRVRVSIGCAPDDRQDTSFLELLLAPALAQ